MELYFTVNKLKTDQQVNHILLCVVNNRLKRCNSWRFTEEEKHSSDITVGKFLEQLGSKENYRGNRLKLTSFRQKAEELLDYFVNSCKRLTQRCSLPETEQWQQIIKLITGTPIPDFRKELLKKTTN